VWKEGVDVAPIPRLGLVIAAVALERLGRSSCLTDGAMPPEDPPMVDGPGRLNTALMGLFGRALDGSVPADGS
jgi:hypothetical protein